MKPKDQDREIFYGLWIIAGCFILLFLFAGAGFYSFSVFIRPLEEHFGWSRAAISFTMSIYMILHGIMSPFVGHLTQTYGPKKVMTLFALGTGASFILVSFTTSLFHFYLAYAFLATCNTGIGFIPVSGLIARWFVRRRGTAIGFAMVGIAVGGLVMAPFTGFVTSHFGWRMTFIFLGILVWVLALPVTLFLIKGSPAELGLMPDGDKPDTGENSDASSEVPYPSPATEDEGWPLRAAYKTREFFWVALTFFLAPMAQAGLLQHQVPLIIEFGISEAVAPAALGLTAGLGGLGKLSFGRISEIVPFRYAAMLCFGLQALAVFVLFNANSMAMVWVYIFIFGFAMGGVIVLLPIVVGYFFGLASFGVIMGTISFFQACGTSSGALISGLIYDHLGNYHYALIVYMCIYIGAIISIFLAGKPKSYAAS